MVFRTAESARAACKIALHLDPRFQSLESGPATESDWSICSLADASLMGQFGSGEGGVTNRSWSRSPDDAELDGGSVPQH